MTLEPCRECDKEISSQAEMCPYCGIGSPATAPTMPEITKTPSRIKIAWGAILSLIVPGLGQIYAGYWRLGTAFLAIIVALLLGESVIANLLVPTQLMLIVVILVTATTLVLKIGTAIDAARRISISRTRLKVSWYKSTWFAAIVYISVFGIISSALPHSWGRVSINSGSNVPALLVGDDILAIPTKQEADFSRGDIVVFRPPGDPSTYYIKRVIGLPGDTVQMTNGQLFINGTLVPTTVVGNYIDTTSGGPVVATDLLEHLPGGKVNQILKETNQGYANNTPLFTVPAGDLFMMGDNRDDSEDSRFMDGPVGYVPMKNVTAKAAGVFYSIDRRYPLYEFWYWPTEIRWDRLFKIIH
jgi:signal peptidase I